jgi:hypothetical protein
MSTLEGGLTGKTLVVKTPYFLDPAWRQTFKDAMLGERPGTVDVIFLPEDADASIDDCERRVVDIADWDVAKAAVKLLSPPYRRPQTPEDVDTATAPTQEADDWESLRQALGAAGFSWEELP